MAQAHRPGSPARDRSDERPGADSAPVPAPRYRAFISYSHEDEAVARWLHKALETWRPPRHLIGRQTGAACIPETLAPIFRDRDELPSSASLSELVSLALEQSACLIVICSPASAHSHWVNQEVRTFQRLGRAGRVFCLIVRGEPNAGQPGFEESEFCFVPALRASGSAHGGGSEPVAADLRPHGDGKRLALLKLISGMLGLGLDELRMREHQRRLRRLSLITALAVLVMLVTTALAIMALLARHSAEVQQSQAEGLVGFMLNDLDERMQGTNRLNTLQAISDRAMAYYQALPSRDVDDSVLSGRSEALKKIGTVQLNQGRLPEALASFQAARKLTAELLAHAPGNAERLLQQATSLNKVGLAWWYMGKPDSALHNFAASARLLQQAADSKPSDIEIASQLAAARNNIGHILERRGDLSGAGTQYRAVLEIYTILRRKEPENKSWRSELGWAYNNVGKLAWRRGQIVRSIANYQVDLDIKKALAAQSPDDREAQGELARSHAILGNTLIHVGQVRAALKHVRRAVEIGESQVKFDPDNATSRDLLALYSMQLARCLRLDGKLPQAREQVVHAQSLLAALARQDPNNAVFRQHLTRVLTEMAKVELLADEQTQTATEHASEAVKLARSLLASRSQSPDIRLLLANALVLDGQVLQSRGEPDTAREKWREARNVMQGVDLSSGDPNQLDAWASTLLLLDDRHAAAGPIARLQQAGYRDPDFMRLVKNHGLRDRSREITQPRSRHSLARKQPPESRIDRSTTGGQSEIPQPTEAIP